MQNKKLLLLAWLIVFPMCLFAQNKENIIKVACIGNSITEGYALTHPETESYPAVLQRLLGDKYKVGNFGLTAHTLMMKGNLPYMAKQPYQDALAFQPDIVTIKLGTNDSKPINWVHKEDFQKDLNTMIDAFEALPSRPRIYLCLPIPSNSEDWGINDSIITYGVIPRIKDVAHERHLPVIDLNTPLRPYYPKEYTDGVHPNKYGAIIIAENIYKALTGRDPVPAPGRADQTLWYDEPAAQWEETLPLGNGRLGMMPDGGVTKEHIVLNEISMWSGSEADYRNPQASESLPRIRQLLFEGKNKEAQELMYTSFVPKKPEKGGTYGCFQMLADMYIDYIFPDTASQAKDYLRWLNLDESVAYTTFTKNGTRYVREYFVSKNKDVMLVHLKADHPEALGFRLTLSRPERGSVRRLGEGKLEIAGTLDSGNERKDGIRYSAITGVKLIGNKSRMQTYADAIEVSDADEAWIIVSANTSYMKGEMYQTETQRLLDQALASDLAQTRQEAIGEYQRLFHRAGIVLPENPAVSALNTDKRLEAFQTQDDPSLAALYYNYGRYLLISSTRPGSLPPNLQGLWANGVTTPWNGDYHTNINIQMNHWPVEPGNLSELYQPMIALVERLVKSGEESAKAFYGKDAKGWVLHMMTNVWTIQEAHGFAHICGSTICIRATNNTLPIFIPY